MRYEFDELWDIVRETSCAKGKWYYPLLWFSAVVYNILLILLTVLVFPFVILFIMVRRIYETCRH